MSVANEMKAVAAEIRENPSKTWNPGMSFAVADWLDEVARQLGLVPDGARVDLRFVARAEAVVKAWRGES